MALDLDSELQSLKRSMHQVLDAAVNRLANKADAKAVVQNFANLKQNVTPDEALLQRAEQLDGSRRYTAGQVMKSLQNAKFSEELLLLLAQYAATGSISREAPKALRKRALDLASVTSWRRVQVIDASGEGKALEREDGDLVRLGTVPSGAGTVVPCTFKMGTSDIVLQAAVPEDRGVRWKTIVFRLEDSAAILSEAWSHPGKGAFRGIRSTWARIQLDWIGIREKDIKEFLEKQEAKQVSKAPRSSGILVPIMPEDIGWWQMDLIFVKFTKGATDGMFEGEEEKLKGGALLGGKRPRGNAIEVVEEKDCRVRTYRVTDSEDRDGIVVKGLKTVKDDVKAFTKVGGFAYILTIIDLFSKYVWAFPLNDKDAKSIQGRLESLFLVEGAPRILQSDNGTEFVNKSVAALSKRYNIDRRLCRPYNSQCDGVVERLNRTLQEGLSRAMYHYRNNNWWEILPLVVYGYNTARHSTTHMSPFLVHRGREPQTVGNVMLFVENEEPIARGAEKNAREGRKELKGGRGESGEYSGGYSSCDMEDIELQLVGGETSGRQPSNTSKPLTESLAHSKSKYDSSSKALVGGAEPDPRLPSRLPRAEASFLTQARAFFKDDRADVLTKVAFRPLSTLLPKEDDVPTNQRALRELPPVVKDRGCETTVVCNAEHPCSFRIGPEVELVTNVEPSVGPSGLDAATLSLADREKRRLQVFAALKGKAVRMVEKSVEKHKVAKSLEKIQPTDADDQTATIEALQRTGLSEYDIALKLAPVAGHRVRLSRLFFTRARAEEKAAFRRPSANVQNWMAYTFRIVAVSPLLSDEKYPKSYYIRLEKGNPTRPSDDEAKALFARGAVVLVDRQYLLPIPELDKDKDGNVVRPHSPSRLRIAANPAEPVPRLSFNRRMDDIVNDTFPPTCGT